MKFIKQATLLLCCLFNLNIIEAQTVKTSAKGACAYKAPVPYAKTLQSLKLPQAEKEKLKKLWGSLYAGYITRSAATSKVADDWNALKANSFINNPFCKYTPLQQDPKDIQDLDICLDRPNKDLAVNIGNCQTNFDNAYATLAFDYWTLIENYLNPQYFNHTFKEGSDWKRNYATFHLYKAVQRLNSICSISPTHLNPKVICTKDPRDLGVIVNLQNNTHTSFLVTQNSLDGKEVKEIGFIEHGLNPLNLHTAALQEALNGAKGGTQSVYNFSFYLVDPMNNKPISSEPLFSVGMYSGKQIIELLQTLPHEKQDVFEMNGRPTSAVHIANPDEWYMLLTQSLTSRGSQTRNPDQRIQAINVSKLDGPYLLTMQINEQAFHHENSHTKQSESVHIFQPSVVTAQVIQPPAEAEQALPLILLPQFLWKLPNLQMYWMFLATSYIAAATDFKFFGPQTFGSAFEYFKHLGYFETKHEGRFVIDKYNILKAGERFYDALWLVGCDIYETNLSFSQDIPQIYSNLDIKNRVVSNSVSAWDLNLQIAFPPKSLHKPSLNLFQKYGFNISYNLPYHQIYTYIFSLPKNDLKESVFVNLIRKKSGLYIMNWTNKQNKLLASQQINLNHEFSDVSVKFLDKSLGHTLDNFQNLIKKFLDGLIELKVLYNEDKQLTIGIASAIDKLIVIQEVIINKYPISKLSFELYQYYQIDPYTKCTLFDENVLPKFLTDLTDLDWESGIYMVPIVENSKSLTYQHPGYLKVIFYKSDKTVLGISQAFNKIIHPVNAYNLSCNTFNKMIDIYFSTGILLKYTTNK